MLRILLFSLVIGLLSCQQSEKSAAGYSPDMPEMMMADEAEPEASTTQPYAQKASSKERKVIHTADLSGEVDDLEKGTIAAKKLIEQYGAYITQQNFSSNSYQIQQNLSIRVPQENFQTLLDALSAQARYVDYQNIRAQDVTEEYFDLQTRLKTKKTVRDRYIEILRDQAKTVEEILLAEEQIRVVQEEIESREGRLRFLQDQVSMSTINFNLYETVSTKGIQQAHFGRRLLDSLDTGWSTFLEFLLAIVGIWPILLLLIGGVWGWRRYRA